MLVAEDNNKIVGFINGKIEKRLPIFIEGKIGFISGIFIEEKYRRKGIGKLFINELTKWFKSKKIKNVELQVHLKNQIGLDAWEKYGFKSILYTQRLKL
jgi:ribosomal protein S18 acetylase RimI-like enzyme